MADSRLLNSFIANLQVDRLRVLADVSSIRQLSRLEFTFFSVYFLY